MPKRTTTAAITLVSNDAGTVALALNAVASPGAVITNWSVDWDDLETEDHTEPLPTSARHAYVSGGARLIVFTVKDSRTKIVSTGINVVTAAAPEPPIPPEPGTMDAAIPASSSGALLGERVWQYQSLAAPFVTTAAVRESPASPNGTTILAPTGRLVAADASVWTWGGSAGSPGQYYILRNSVNTQGHSATMKSCDGLIYHLGGDGQNWYRWVNGAYEWSGTVEPCVGVTPS